MSRGEFSKKAGAILKNKYALAVLLFGVLLMVLPAVFSGGGEEKAGTDAENTYYFSLESEERRLEESLGAVSGAGRVKVLLALESSGEAELAQNDGETLVISSGSGTQKVVEVSRVSPVYRGAVVICPGAESASVRLSITQAVSLYTGLSSSKIAVITAK